MEFASSEYFEDICKWAVSVILVIFLAFFLVWGFGQRATVEGNSMSDILQDNQLILIDKAAYAVGDIQRYDIVYFNYGSEAASSSIKRIIGLPGESITISDGKVFVNGTVLPLPENAGNYYAAGIAESDIRLGPDEYFLLGDRGDNSEDSRFDSVGLIKKENIIGKVWFCVYPLGGFGYVAPGKPN